MPFTFSHPAIIIPLTKLPKRYISVTGLVAGSMAPDFEYFFRMKPVSEYSHTLAGIITFDLPVALIVAYLYHLLIRKPVIEHLPSPLFYRFHPFRCFNWSGHVKKFLFPVIFSILIGAFSHIFWDSFTHEAGFGVQSFPFLMGKIWGIPFYRIVQHLSTLAGFATISWSIYKMKENYATPPALPNVLDYWIKVFFVTAAVSSFIVGSFVALFHYEPARGIIVVSIINSFFLGLTLASIGGKKLSQKFK